MRGITLIEMVVVIGLTVLVGGALLGIIQSFYRTNAYVFESASSVDNARRGLATSLQHIREASYSDDGAYPLSSAATSTVTFYSDIDRDGGIERVRIYIEGDTLYRGTTNAGGNPPIYDGQTEATSVLAYHVRNTDTTPLFQYYDSSGALLSSGNTDVSLVAVVRATLMVDLNPNRAPEILTLTGSATLRNLKDQL